MQNVIALGRVGRDRKKLPIKTPLRDFKVVHSDAQYLADLETLKPYLLEELNVRGLTLTTDTGSFVTLRAEPDRERLGKRLRKEMGAVATAIQALTQEQLKVLLEKGEIEVLGHALTTEDVKVIREFKGDSRYEAGFSEDALTMLDCLVDDELRSEGLAREVINRVQKLRKKAGLLPTDPVEIFYTVSSIPSSSSTPADAAVTPATLEAAIEARADYIKTATKLPLVNSKFRTNPSVTILHEKTAVESVALDLAIVSCCFAFDPSMYGKEFASEPQLVEDIKTAVLSMDYFRAKKQISENNGKLNFVLNGRPIELVAGQGLYISAFEKSRFANITQSH